MFGKKEELTLNDALLFPSLVSLLFLGRRFDWSDEGDHLGLAKVGLQESLRGVLPQFDTGRNYQDRKGGEVLSVYV